MKKQTLIRVLSVCCAICLATSFCRADQADDEAAIRKSDDAYVEAYNKQDAKLEIKVNAIKFMSPNVAIESGTARIIRPKAEPDESTYSALFVKRDRKWLLDRVTEEEPPAPTPSSYDHLKDLEWMVGSWI